MIEIINSQIIRDGEIIGVIDGNTAYVTEKQAPRIVGQIRAAAGNPDLVVEVGAPTVKESLPVAEPNEIGVIVEVPEVAAEEPAPAPIQAEKETWDLTGFPDPKKDKQTFRICFVNHYGNDAYGRWRAANA